MDNSPNILYLPCQIYTPIVLVLHTTPQLYAIYPSKRISKKCANGFCTTCSLYDHDRF